VSGCEHSFPISRWNGNVEACACGVSPTPAQRLIAEARRDIAWAQECVKMTSQAAKTARDQENAARERLSRALMARQDEKAAMDREVTG
jgi:hypothetical protein